MSTQQVREQAVTDEVIASFAGAPSERLREVMSSLVRHLHDFAREVRLTEAEWQRASYGSSDSPFPWGPETPGPEHGYFDFARWDPLPVDAFPRGRSEFGVEGLLANGWEWTSTPFGPFAGFQAFPFYEGYSANFFDGKHFVMKGGSPRTGRSMLRRSFRNWFQPHYPYVYAGFRCAGGGLK